MYTQRALKLLPRTDTERPTALNQLQSCDFYLGEDKKLSAFLQDEATPADPKDIITWARMCQELKRQHAAAARLYAYAFAAEPKLAADPNQFHRYNAACSAVRAAVGQGEDARLLPDKVTGMFRRWALGWLRDDLTAYSKMAERNDLAANKIIHQRLTHWRGDPDLASLRESSSLDRLPDNERAAWQRYGVRWTS